MTVQDAFEELRFVWELLAAECTFLLPFAKRKKGFLFLAVLGVLGFSLLAMGYFLVLELQNILPYPLIYFAIGGWYIGLALLTILYCRCCFHLTAGDALYIGAAGYSAQHIVYVLIHELLVRALWPELSDHFLLYALVSLCACALMLAPLYWFFAPQLRQCGGQMFPDSPLITATHALLLAALMFCTFSCQHIFEMVDGYQELAASLGLTICVLMLCLQYGALRAVRSGQERTVVEQMLRDSAAHYDLTREMVDHINRTCHDLKHSLNALKTVSEEERQGYIEEVERDIEQYRQLVHCDNEALNTILAEKSLYCDRRQIRLSCAVDCARLDFMSLPDLYALLGNAIDNAIECVDSFSDSDRRIVSLSIRRQNAFVCIQTNNYCDEVSEMENGLPRTTKPDKAGHGFGLKSIRYLAEKYGGRMCVSVQDHIFILQIMLPVS